MKEYEKAITNRTRILQHQKRVRCIAKQFYSITLSNIPGKNISISLVSVTLREAILSNQSFLQSQRYNANTQLKINHQGFCFQ